MTETTTEKDPFDELADQVDQPVPDADDFEFEEIEVVAAPEDFKAAELFLGGRFVELENNQWVLLTIIQARLVKGTQDWNMGQPQIEVYAEHAADKYLAGRRYPYRMWAPLVEVKSLKGNKRRPGAKLLAATGLMPPVKDGAEESSVKITRDMVAKDVDDEGNDIIVIPGLEGAQIMGQIEVKPGDPKPVLDENGAETGQMKPGFPKEILRDMVSAVPNRIIKVQGATEAKDMEVVDESVSSLMEPIKAGTIVGVSLISEGGEVGDAVHGAVRTAKGTWQLAGLKAEQESGRHDEFN